MKKIILLIVVIFGILNGFAQKNEIPKLTAYPLHDSIITLIPDSQYIKMYMLTPVAEEIVRMFPGMLSINSCNRRLAEMKIDLTKYDSLYNGFWASNADTSATNKTRFGLYANKNEDDFLFFEKSNRDFETRFILYFQKSGSVWFYADYNNGLCSIISSSTTLNMIMINLKPKKREFTHVVTAPLSFYINTIARKEKYVKIHILPIINK